MVLGSLACSSFLPFSDAHGEGFLSFSCHRLERKRELWAVWSLEVGFCNRRSHVAQENVQLCVVF